MLIIIREGLRMSDATAFVELTRLDDNALFIVVKDGSLNNEKLSTTISQLR